MPKDFCLLLSLRPTDLALAQSIATAGGLEPRQAVTPGETEAFLSRHPNTALLWDVDEFGPEGGRNPLCDPEFARIIGAHAGAERVFVLSSFAFSHLVQFKEVHPAGHFILRRSLDETGCSILGRIAATSSRDRSIEFSRYLPEGSESAVRQLKLTRSGQRRLAVEAVSNVLKESKLPTRLIGLAAQATDELLMNALFDAPVDASGERFRKNIKRTTDFPLESRDSVTVEYAATKGYVAISVVDLYGSFNEQTLASYAGRDHWGRPYDADLQTEAANIGIYGMIESGLSLLFVCRPGELTKALLFVPRIHGYRDFKKGFQFFGIFQAPASATASARS